MNTFKTKKDLQSYLGKQREDGLRIALIPTMGALHSGHLSLLDRATQIADIVVCSIFVNPTQFNDPKDLEKYPRPIENDLQLLKQAGCDVVFMPTVEEMYLQNEPAWNIDLGDLDSVWEGQKRPGHFQGVTQIVYKLFTLVKPDVACFGQKDFQQIMVIKRMIEIKDLPITVEICSTIRSKEGLALSSRNMRLSEQGKNKALALFRALSYIKTHFTTHPPAVLKENAADIITRETGLEIEYIAICESRNLKEIQTIDFNVSHVALLVVWIEGVRLIDNIILN